jgi:hypothetical protein
MTTDTIPCQYEWCAEDSHEDDMHYGRIGSATAGESKVDVTLMLLAETDEYPDSPPSLTFNLDFGEGWEIDYGDIDTEVADLRSIVDQISAILYEARTSIGDKTTDIARHNKTVAESGD